MKKYKILLAGGGGINSWFADQIDKLRAFGQIGENYYFTVIDPDTVERKNLVYQNFTEEDLLAYKAESLANRYIMEYENTSILHEKQLDPYDIVISGVDNSKFRRMFFEYMHKHPKKYWVDMRAEGTQIAIYTKHPKNTLPELIATLPNETLDASSTSCQRSWELGAGVVQLGNKIVALIGAQFLLNHIRGGSNPPSYTHLF
jgi:molybdopterin/thiamine biosynthesis adenylyltransferase